ncbi:MAG: YeeE/YedE thiosulfate transporter family protein [Sulfuritalea sp.]|nr:YeeE/YedE thiosulfate transporter family protein [Sulfuritalea sp.]MDP1983373.1 YeeE/YedE thiosulfate transporter family protein [Sulfuritalea sp.]
MNAYMPIALAPVMLIGFAAHRASLCTVRAVAETMSSGTAWMLGSFLKAAAWAAAISGSLILLFPAAALPTLERTPHAVALAGGFVFGVGAAVNGGCSLSTLQRLADGDLSMLGTLAAFVIGVLAASGFDASQGSGTLRQVASFWLSGNALVVPLLLLLWLWVLAESLRLWRSSSGSGASLWARVLAPAYRLSSAAALLGIAAGILYNLQGAWTYTSFLRAEAASWLDHTPTPSGVHALLVIALLAGMLASSWQRRSFSPGNRWRQWPRRMTGGLLMGAGGALVPGGNDTLILAAVPTASIWALASYLALIAGVAATLFAMRVMAGKLPAVECSNDQCR